MDKTSIFKDSSSSEELLSLHSIMEQLGGVYKLDELNAGIRITLPGIKQN